MHILKYMIFSKSMNKKEKHTSTGLGTKYVVSIQNNKKLHTLIRNVRRKEVREKRNKYVYCSTSLTLIKTSI